MIPLKKFTFSSTVFLHMSIHKYNFFFLNIKIKSFSTYNNSNKNLFFFKKFGTFKFFLERKQKENKGGKGI